MAGLVVCWAVARRRERRRLQRRRSLPVERRNAHRPRRNVLSKQVRPTRTLRACSNCRRTARTYLVGNRTLSSPPSRDVALALQLELWRKPNAGTLAEPRPAPPPRAGIDPDVPDQRERRRRALFLFFPEGATIFCLRRADAARCIKGVSAAKTAGAPNRRERMLSGPPMRLQNAKIKLQETGARVSRKTKEPRFSPGL